MIRFTFSKGIGQQKTIKAYDMFELYNELENIELITCYNYDPITKFMIEAGGYDYNVLIREMYDNDEELNIEDIERCVGEKLPNPTDKDLYKIIQEEVHSSCHSFEFFYDGDYLVPFSDFEYSGILFDRKGNFEPHLLWYNSDGSDYTDWCACYDLKDAIRDAEEYEELEINIIDVGASDFKTEISRKSCYYYFTIPYDFSEEEYYKRFY